MNRILILVLGFISVLALDCSAQDVVQKFSGVCFSSVRDNESPARQIQSLPSAIEEDVAMAGKLAKSIRTYTISGSNYLIPEFCQKQNIDCIVGAWIGPSAWQNDAQIELLIHLAKSGNQRIKTLIVGNEVLHRGDCTESQLIQYIRQVKASTDIPVASADTWRAWTEHPKLAHEVDVCGVQIYPYWEGRSIEGAAAYTVQRVLDVQKMYPTKRIVLTEFGWPTQGESLGEAHASPENAARYLREVIPLLEQAGIEYYYFSIWDEKWKVGPEGNVGAHWGLFSSNGEVKPEFESLLPSEGRIGNTRTARQMTFQLDADRGRNVEIAEAAFGKPPTEAELQLLGQPGVGLNVSIGQIHRNSYEGLRPLQIQSDKNLNPPATESIRQESPSEKKEPLEKNVPKDVEDRSSDASVSSEPAESTGTKSVPGARDAAKRKPLEPNEIYGVCLSLFRDEETPHYGVVPLLSEIKGDISFASTMARAVRTYSVTDSFAMVPEFCDELGLECFPGASLGKYPWLNELELEMLIRVGQSGHPSVRALIVGNEVMHRGDFSVEQYIQYIRRVKKSVKVPVATAELLHSWMEHPELADEVDILGVQIYPYWGGLTIEKAAANTLESVQQLQARFPGKQVILTEFGWPTDGGTIGDAVASPENAARYLKEVLPLLNQNKIEYMYFAMTDEKWKQRDEGGPGPHWGLLYSNGQTKPAFRALLPASAVEGMVRPARKINFD